MTTATTLPLSKLVASDAINARAATREDLDQLVASIEAKGLIQALAVRPADGGGDRYEIIDGRRRYQALQALVKAKRIKRDAPVPVLIRNEDDAEALETSLAANTVRLPMHPVDQHEVFARLAAQGHAETDIAARFGIAPRTVRQHLALGRLAEPVRAAWRKGRIDAEAAQAFAIHPDPAVQAATLDKLGKRVDAWAVRNELADERERADQSDELALVGEAAYLAAGGAIDEDLFSDARYVRDVPLAKKLARDLLLAKCEALRKAGWAWAEIEDEAGFRGWDCSGVLGDGQDDDLDDTHPWTAAQRAASGCLVRIADEGWGKDKKVVVGVSAGLIKPDRVRRQAAGQTDLEDAIDEADGDDGDPGPLPSARALAADDAHAGPWDISGALLESITGAQTSAAARALGREPTVALRVALASLLNGNLWQVPAKLYVDHLAPGRKHDGRSFEAILADLQSVPQTDLLWMLADVVAGSLQITRLNASPHPHHDALVFALDGEAYGDQMRALFSPADYFKRARRETAIAALEEMAAAGRLKGLHAGAGLDTMKKQALADWAAEQATRWGWLPPQIRHPAYALLEPERLTGKTAAAEQSSEADTTTPRRRRARA